MPSSPTPRRGFLGRLIGGAAALAGSSAIAPRLGAQEPPVSADWDMSWVNKLTAEHRMVFDAPEFADGTVFRQVRTWLAGYAEVYGSKDTELNAVMVIRHQAIAMAVGDEIWAAMDLGTRFKLNDPSTGQPARRNPFIKLKPDDKHSTIYPDGGLDALMGRGVIALACNLALMRFAGELAAHTKVSRDEARKQLVANLVPGVTLMPSGIFAVGRAQEAGCHFIRST